MKAGREGLKAASLQLMDKGNTAINKNQERKEVSSSMIKPWKNPLEPTKTSNSENVAL